MIDLLNVVRRYAHGLVTVRQRAGSSPADRQQLMAQITPIPFVGSHRLPTGGSANVATSAASYWATLPRLELPETNLTPHYLEDFVLHPPTGAA